MGVGVDADVAGTVVSVGAERALYVRLFLLQGVVAIMRGEMGKGKDLLTQAGQECWALLVQEEDVADLITRGYNRTEATRALRATSSAETPLVPKSPSSSQAVAAAAAAAAAASPAQQQAGTSSVEDAEAGRAAQVAQAARVNAAATYAAIKRKDANDRKRADRARAQAERQRRKLGKCGDGRLLDMSLVQGLVGAGFPRRAVVAALKKGNNSESEAVLSLTSMLSGGGGGGGGGGGSSGDGGNDRSQVSEADIAIVLSVIPQTTVEAVGL
jgi:hypothetical protein